VKIYTKTGDEGLTSLFGGKRVPKNSLRVEVFGNVDELNAFFGVILSLKPHKDIKAILGRLQNDLFVLGSDLSTPINEVSSKAERIQEIHVKKLEENIDQLEPRLKPLQSFILPGGTQVGSHLHAARTVCRRTERLAVQLSKTETIGPLPIIYLNRLSDLLFVLARYANAIAKQREKLWEGSND
jgi:cob(I)alamin adenosyltransferase